MSSFTCGHIEQLQSPEYRDMLAHKRDTFEQRHPDDQLQSALEYSKSAEYQQKNFERKHLSINPLKACQPLGALLAAVGFEKCLPYVHGSQGCASYFRSHFSRHFKEPFAAVSDSMSEDAAVFGGHKNMYEGLENATRMYQPGMVAICTSCMAEVIGDDLASFVKNARTQGNIPADLPVAAAHTPSFVGSHTTGYDNMMLAILEQFAKVGGEKRSNRVNIIMGFDTYIGNYREIRRICSLFGLDALILSDPSETLDSPTDGQFQMYRGGTSLADLADAPQSAATIVLQPDVLTKTIKHIQSAWDHDVRTINPLGIAGTDELMLALAEISGKDVPEQVSLERGRLVDAIGDSYYWIYGKRFAINGDPDTATGLARFILELGGEPRHVLISNGNKKWARALQKELRDSPLGQETDVYYNKDMWHLRSLLFSEPVDYIIGNSFAKFLTRDTGIPLIRIGFPILDRHHLHRSTTIGYQGGINMLTWIVNQILEETDRATVDGPSYDLVR